MFVYKTNSDVKMTNSRPKTNNDPDTAPAIRAVELLPEVGRLGVPEGVASVKLAETEDAVKSDIKHYSNLMALHHYVITNTIWSKEKGRSKLLLLWNW